MASSASKMILGALVFAALTETSLAQINPGWLDDFKDTLLGDPAQLTLPLPPVSSFGKNPLTPTGAARPTVLEVPATAFKGIFVELTDADPTGRLHVADDDEPHFQFNRLTVSPDGRQFETRYDVEQTVPLVDGYAKSLLIPDSTGQLVLGSAAGPGNQYVCKSDGRTNFCTRTSPITTAKTGRRSSPKRRYIFDSDTRNAVPTAARTANPYRVVGIVGNHCTGTLVGPRHVLTAGHCVHTGPGGDWIADLSFRPAFDKDAPVATQAPYGKFAWASATTTNAWARSGSWNSDYAIITLAQDTGLGWMSFGYHSGINSNWAFNMNGYPGSTLWGKMYHHFGSLSSANSENLRYREIDMVKGTSGSGVYLYSGGNRRIYGVNNVQYWLLFDSKGASDNYIPGHTWPSYNQAVRITSAKFVNLCGWINAPAALGC